MGPEVLLKPCPKPWQPLARSTARWLGFQSLKTSMQLGAFWVPALFRERLGATGSLCTLGDSGNTDIIPSHFQAIMV